MEPDGPHATRHADLSQLREFQRLMRLSVAPVIGATLFLILVSESFATTGDVVRGRIHASSVTAATASANRLWVVQSNAGFSRLATFSADPLRRARIIRVPRLRSVAVGAGIVWVTINAKDSASPSATRDNVRAFDTRSGQARANLSMLNAGPLAVIGDDAVVLQPGTVTRVRPRHFVWRRRLPTQQANAIAVGGGAIWVAATAFQRRRPIGVIYRLNLGTGRITTRFTTPSPVDALAATPNSLWLIAGSTLFYARPPTGHLHRAVATSPLALASAASGVWVGTAGGRLLHFQSDGQLAASLKIGGEVDAVAAAGKRVWAFDRSTSEIVLVG